MTVTTTWEPGDPLYERATYRQYLFNFRDDARSETCYCADAASWPEPQHFQDLDVMESAQQSAVAAVAAFRAQANARTRGE